MKPPFRLWRIEHQSKLAARRGDLKAVENLYWQYVKAKARLAMEQK